MNDIKYGVLNCHTDNSLRESAMSVTALVKRAKTLGAPAIALTDHGTMCGYVDFIDSCKKEGVEPIVGIEADIEDEMGEGRLILMAKDYQGFQALIKAVSESNRRLAQAQSKSWPKMDKAMLTDYFGPGSPGYGHIVVTSGCVSGVLGRIFLCQYELDKKISSLRKKQKQYESPDSKSYRKNSQILSEIKEQLNSLEERITRIELMGQATDGYLLCQLQNEKKEADSRLKSLSQIIQQSDRNINKWKRLQQEINQISETVIPECILYETLKKEAQWYCSNFGKDNFYIELQYHGRQNEKKIMPKLAGLATEQNISVCISNYVQIPVPAKDAITARTVIRTLMSDEWETPSAADRELAIKTDSELIMSISKIIPQSQVIEGLENIGKIVSECNLDFPRETHYPHFATPDGTTSAEYLEKITREHISSRYTLKEFSTLHSNRLEHELKTIIRLGYADYYCIVHDLIRYAKAAGKLDLQDPAEIKYAYSYDIDAIEKITKGRVGQCVGPGRGSSAGSIVCYILGITNIDPMKYGLLFERFLNPERVSMPDIDVDIDCNVRPYVIAYVRYKYGTNAVCGIMTRGTQTGKKAILTAGRVYGIEKANNPTAYLELSAAISKKAVELTTGTTHIRLSGILENLKTIYAKNKYALEIIHYATLIEGSTTQIGQHPGGIIITDGKPVDEYVPLQYNAANDIMTTQCDMTQAERMGLLKIDILALRNITIISDTLKEIYKSKGQSVDMDHITFEKEIFYQIYSMGRTNSVFQCESDGMKKMMRTFGPQSFTDLMLLIAIYRPGPIQFLPDVIAVKTGKRKIQYLTPELEPILNDTYGTIIYQEQVLDIFKQLAGYSLGQADIVRRAMSKKDDDVMAAERGAFLYGDSSRGIKGCIANGIEERKAIELFSQISDFSKYCFNKSHAACYAVVSYQTAWLKYYHPKEYMMSVLNNIEFKKLSGTIEELKTMKIKIELPDINKSEFGFSLRGGSMIFGLGSINGFGGSIRSVLEERNQSGPFKSIQDFIVRMRPAEKVLIDLADAGAFDSFCPNRTAIKEEIPGFIKLIDKLKKYEQILQDNPSQRQQKLYTSKHNKTVSSFHEITFNLDICENPFERLKLEKELLSTPISKRFLDLYPDPHRCGAVNITEVLRSNQKYVTVVGMISGFKLMHRRGDGADMGVFYLNDKTGVLEACCFTAPFSQFKDYLKDDLVVKIQGNIMSENNGNTKKLSVESVCTVMPIQNTILIFIKDIEDWEATVLKNIKPYVSQNGNPTVVYDLFMDEFRKCDLLLSPAILRDKKVRTSLHNFGI